MPKWSTSVPVRFLAERDKIVDSMKVKDHLKEVIKKSEKGQVVQYETDHARPRRSF